MSVLDAYIPTNYKSPEELEEAPLREILTSIANYLARLEAYGECDSIRHGHVLARWSQINEKTKSAESEAALLVDNARQLRNKAAEKHEIELFIEHFTHFIDTVNKDIRKHHGRGKFTTSASAPGKRVQITKTYQVEDGAIQNLRNYVKLLKERTEPTEAPPAGGIPVKKETQDRPNPDQYGQYWMITDGKGQYAMMNEQGECLVISVAPTRPLGGSIYISNISHHNSAH